MCIKEKEEDKERRARVKVTLQKWPSVKTFTDPYVQHATYQCISPGITLTYLAIFYWSGIYSWNILYRSKLIILPLNYILQCAIKITPIRFQHQTDRSRKSFLNIEGCLSSIAIDRVLHVCIGERLRRCSSFLQPHVYLSSSLSLSSSSSSSSFPCKRHEDSSRSVILKQRNKKQLSKKFMPAALRINSRSLQIVNHVLQRKLLLYIWSVTALTDQIKDHFLLTQ